MDAAQASLEPPSTAQETLPLLSARFSARYGQKIVLHDVALNVGHGEILGLVGSSGAGKSTLVNSLLGLLSWSGGMAEGRIEFDGRDLLRLSERELRQLRGRDIALVPQSPLASLNPSLRLKRHFEEAWRAHHKGAHVLAAATLATLLEGVQLPTGNEFLQRRPGQISVGQAQRVLIATALLHAPRLLIADEPTSALDPITQAEILRLLQQLAFKNRTAMLFISHDLLSVFQLCDRIAILHEGRIVECKPPHELALTAQHPHTRALLSALPVPPHMLLLRQRPAGVETPCVLNREDSVSPLTSVH